MKKKEESTLLYQGGKGLRTLGRDGGPQALRGTLHGYLIVEFEIKFTERSYVLASETAVNELPENDAKGVDVGGLGIVLSLGGLVDGRRTLGLVAGQDFVLVPRVREVTQLRDPYDTEPNEERKTACSAREGI